jgi:hypothetical protein
MREMCIYRFNPSAALCALRALCVKTQVER